MTDLKELIRTERHALTDFLETLTPDEWATPSLCGEWTVQDVAAHLAVAPSMSIGAGMAGLLQAGFRINRFNADAARRWSRRGVPAILEQLRINADTDARPIGVPPLAPLADALVHTLDIRRPLGKAGLPQRLESFAPVADWTAVIRWPGTMLIGGSVRKRIDGVRLVTDDLEWSHGDGPEAHGSAEAILLLLFARPIGPGELTGPGAGKIYERLT
jgi:uncharacterized protein (TIGR03083 family)